LGIWQALWSQMRSENIFSGRSRPWVGLSLMAEPDFFVATRPLWEAGQVEVVEWSFDYGWGRELPTWLLEILRFFSDRDRLLGHGVSYSLLSAEWQAQQSVWLDQLAAELQKYRYHHVSEHFGWMGAGNFAQSAPLSLPLRPETLALGIERLQKLAAVSSVPIGLENLAFAWSAEDAEQQGSFIRQLLAPVQGFLLLDLHNLYCQTCNFERSAQELLAQYPLELVREIHISGGSWSFTGKRRMRRDTHDGAVPAEVFQLLTQVVPKCPNLQAVILERLGHTLRTEEEQRGLREDFDRLRRMMNIY
jgi:uncharacterized protein